MGLPQPAEDGDDNNGLTKLIGGVVQLWLRCDAARRREMADEFFSTPDECSRGMTDFLHGLIVQILSMCDDAQSEANDAEQLTRALSAWLLASHTLVGDGTGLFVIGHRANHSCDPSAAYHADDDGHLVYRALRPIAAGEAVCFSYLHLHELLMATRERQVATMERKRFVCACARCTSGGASGGGTSPEPGHQLPSASGEAAHTATLARESELIEEVQLFLAPEFGSYAHLNLEPADNVYAQLSKAPEWSGHWVWAVSLWAAGFARLRRGVEKGNHALARSGTELLRDYAHWVEATFPGRRHFVAIQFAEIYACYAALADKGTTGTNGDACWQVVASELCAPFLPSLEALYGADDVHNTAMRNAFRGHCGGCGAKATSHCSKCRLIGYCGAACQRTAWPAHKRVCNDCGAR